MKKFLKWVGGIILFFVVLAISLVGPIDRSPLEGKSFYKEMMVELDTIKPVSHPATQILKVGWSMANITPGYSMPMAGYTQRPRFESVHDSLYTRIVAVDNGTITCYFITADLLLFPPDLRDRISEKITAKGWKDFFLYLSATHTHNGVGGWHSSVLGKVALGEYHEEWIEETAQAIVMKMEEAYTSRLDSRIAYFENDVSESVENRIAFKKGEIDGLVRGFSIERADSTKGIVFTFSAHATSIGKDNLVLSGDYPAATIQQLHSKGWNFGMYMAGMVGSHRFKFRSEQNFDAVKVEAEILTEKILSSSFAMLQDSLEIKTINVPIQFGSSQLRIDKDWKVRDWAFWLLANRLEGEVTYLQLGNLTFMGTPCDFSGELFTREKLGVMAEQFDKKLIITSFNGDYAGYITYDPHYETLSKEEVMALNWVGPHYGAYFSTIVKRLLEK
ncbi:MAG TPA: neutral/alkaline non-lysosomal ceramidase N-terminal domain-containing protein [Cyclobacteriaceae bacterium]